MNYKKIFKSKKIRLKILKLLDFIPDRFMIKLQYRISTGRKLNLKEPKRFTEKIQWYKLYYRNPLMIQCSDKYNVRKYVASKGLDEHLIPLFGIYEHTKQIDFDNLPQSFVLKTTNGSHTNIICKDKSTLDITKTESQINRWLNEWSGKVGREWAYYLIEPKIIIEKYISDDSETNLIDYKFFCFNGEPKYLYVITDRSIDNKGKLGIFDLDFEQLAYERIDIDRNTKKINKPDNFENMINIAKILSKDFPHVRVDLYNIKGKIFFGELTFYNGSGYKGYKPDEFDFLTGEKFILPKEYK